MRVETFVTDSSVWTDSFHHLHNNKLNLISDSDNQWSNTAIRAIRKTVRLFQRRNGFSQNKRNEQGDVIIISSPHISTVCPLLWNASTQHRAREVHCSTDPPHLRRLQRSMQRNVVTQSFCIWRCQRRSAAHMWANLHACINTASLQPGELDVFFVFVFFFLCVRQTGVNNVSPSHLQGDAWLFFSLCYREREIEKLEETER